MSDCKCQPALSSHPSFACNINADSTTTDNPFARREQHSSQALIVHRITTLITYLLFLVTAAYYTFNAAESQGKHARPGHTIWGNNQATPFAQNSIITSIYW